MWPSRGTEFNRLKQKTKQYTSLGNEDSEVPFKPCDHLTGQDISEYDSWKGTSMLESGLIGPHFLLSTSVKITHGSCLFLLCTRVKCTEDLSKRKTSEAEERWRRAECSPSITVPSCQAFAIWTSRVCVCWLPGLGFHLLLLNWHVAANYSRSTVVGYGYK